MKVVLLAVPYINTRVPPLGITLLKTELIEQGIDCKAFDLNIDCYSNAAPEYKHYWRFSESYYWNNKDFFFRVIYPVLVEPRLNFWIDEICAEKPTLVGISLSNSPIVEVIAKKLKEKNPKLILVAGGARCSVEAYQKNAFKADALFDYTISGEGELQLVNLVRAIQSGVHQDLPRNLPILIKTDLTNVTPPDFTDYDLEKYIDANDRVNNYELPVYFSRGCVGACHFCVDYRMWGKPYRCKSVEQMVSELVFLKEKYQRNRFFFIELLLNGNHKQLDGLISTLIEKKLILLFGLMLESTSVWIMLSF